MMVDVSAYRPGYDRYVRGLKLFFEQRWGHISTNKFALIWVVIGDQEFLSVRVMVDGE